MYTWVVDHYPIINKGYTHIPFTDSARSFGHRVIDVRTTHDDSNMEESVTNLGIDFSELNHVIVRGSCGFVEWFCKEYDIKYPGGFLHPTNFHLPNYAPILGELALNHNLKTMPYGEFKMMRNMIEHELGERLFVKPADGTKRFTGVALESGEALDHIHFHKYRHWNDVPDDFLVSVAPAHEIISEYRFVIVNDKPVTGSCYKSGPYMTLDHPIPDHVWETVRHIASVHHPHDVYVADIAETPNGNFLIEYNQFGTSGMYKCCEIDILMAICEDL